MSHITTIDTRIADTPASLKALEAACTELGALLLRDKPTYNWYGFSVGDYPLPAGFTKEMLGKCAHVIKLPGVNYEIGLVRDPMNPKQFIPMYDFYSSSYGQDHDGDKLKQWGGGVALPKLKQSYAYHAASQSAKAKGWGTQRKQNADGSITLLITT